jgi:hypothetical protein
MHLSQTAFDDIGAYFIYLPARMSKLGRKFIQNGNVFNLRCKKQDSIYLADVLDQHQTFQVELEHTEDGWLSSCSCGPADECEHATAVLLKLQALVIRGAGTTPSSRTAGRPITPGIEPAQVTQPPRSALCDALVEKLGRPLQKAEAEFILHVQRVFEQSRTVPLTEQTVAALSDRPNPYQMYNYWKSIEIWPGFLRDDFRFWLFVAWELRLLNLRWPAFMDGITDLALIEPDIKALEHQKEIKRWKSWFQDYREAASAPDPGTLELRLAIGPNSARLQWRTQPEAPFSDLKQSHVKTLSAQFDGGNLTLTPDSLPIWSCVFKPWSHESWWSFKYSDDSARPGLSRLLRMPLAADCVVTEDGRPLVRFDEPLRLHLNAPHNGGHMYELLLVRADGSPSPRVLCTLPGRPTLYLTEAGLFQGPPSDALGDDLSKCIPSAALETTQGLGFLNATGVPLPEHLRQRIRTIPVGVSISCQIKPIYPGSPTEDIHIKVTASARGMQQESFGPSGWTTAASPYETNKAIPKEKKEDGVIHIFDHAAQAHFPRLLVPLGLKWESYPGHWKLRLTKKTPELFVPWLKSLPPEIQVKLDRELATLRDEPVSGSVSLDVTEDGIDWFDLKVMLNVADTTLTPEELKLLLNAKGGYVRLGDKGWRRLQFNLTPEDDEQLARLGLNARDFSSETQRFHALQLADDAAARFLGPDRVEKIQRRVSELKARVAPSQPQSIHAEMRPYQTDGFHFLAYLSTNRFGGVLADDMGLGKTLQTLAWIAWMRQEIAGASASSTGSAALPSLVVCPKSVMDNWRSEAERFYSTLRVRLWHGEPDTELAAARESSDLVVVNYSQLRALSPAIAGVEWLAAILDEAQYIKNPDSQTAQAARALRAVHRLALTGTPIENRLLDLWSIVGFAMPGALGNRTHFLRHFDAKDDPLARRRLAARVRPFLLRRTKTQVAKDLPDRVEEDLLCEMEGVQKTLYTAELKRARALILGLESNKQLNQERFNILTSLLRLRQICCHPALVDQKLLKAESAKVEALVDLLEPLMEEGHKVLVFSQFVTMLDILRNTMKQRKWPFFYLAGETENRGDLVKEFQSAEDGAVFLISLKAGGFGLNLTAASYVVLFDPWWNPAVESQAIDRTHRIGQTSKVMAYRLLMRDSIEQKIRQLQKQKAALAEDVLGEERFAQSLTLDDLRYLFAE